MERLVGYGLGAAGASLFYVVWSVMENPPPGIDIPFRIGLALFFWLADGFCLVPILMSAPWIVVVWLSRRRRWAGCTYFVSIGAFLTFAIGCTTASLSPKPLFIEDQTFLEGALIAAGRQGVCFGLAGMIHGFIYWIISSRSTPPQSNTP